MKIEDAGPGMIRVECKECGGMYEVADFRGKEYESVMRSFFERGSMCPACQAETRRRRRIAEQQRYVESRRRRLREIAQEAGLPRRYIPERIPCPAVYGWIAERRDRNILLSGETGTGKSTSACLNARDMLIEPLNVRYCEMRDLLAKWTLAKTSEDRHSPERMLRGLFALDLLIVDEAIGRARMTLAGQEFIFALLEAVNAGRCHARVWLLGNFYLHSIEENFHDPEPLRRRLQENFVCGMIDRRTRQVREIDVWSEQ